MALIWMDNFNIYGTDAGRNARMLDGAYVDTGRSSLAVDPDPTAGGGQVLLKTGGGFGGDQRKVLPTARTTVGVASRYWFPVFPSHVVAGSEPTLVALRDANNVQHLGVRVDPSGFLHVYRNDNAAEVEIGVTANPVLLTHAWQHVEVKTFLDVAVGTVEIRVEGVTVLNIGPLRTTTDRAGAVLTCQNVCQMSAWEAIDMYVKDYIIWDNTGAFNNNFMGSCQVYKIIPDADVSLNWTPTPADGIGFDKINEVTPDDDTRYITAPFPLPAAYKCSLSDLPATVTSVRGVMPIHRSRKTDGGDGNLQVGLISGGSTGLGANRPITTAYTYWTDVYDADPNGGIGWTRPAVNALNLQINRTV